MNEIKDLLQAWQDGEYINPDGIKAAYDLVSLLVAKVEALEAQIQNLSNTQ